MEKFWQFILLESSGKHRNRTNFTANRRDLGWRKMKIWKKPLGKKKHFLDCCWEVTTPIRTFENGRASTAWKMQAMQDLKQTIADAEMDNADSVKAVLN